jgi:glyoxylase-like metal-dependent hydrolase (beta-lactamase superfamily II)
MAGNADFLRAIKVPFLLHPDERPVLQVAPHTPFALFVQAKASPPPDRYVRDGDIIEIGEEKFTVMHTPGHSPGSISLLGEGCVFVGDVLFYTSIGRTDFPGCSYEALLKSIRTKLLPLPDDTIVYPGHGPETTIGFERVNNPFLD